MKLFHLISTRIFIRKKYKGMFLSQFTDRNVLSQFTDRDVLSQFPEMSFPVYRQGCPFPVYRQGCSFPVCRQGCPFPVNRQGCPFPVYRQGVLSQFADRDVLSQFTDRDVRSQFTDRDVLSQVTDRNVLLFTDLSSLTNPGTTLSGAVVHIEAASLENQQYGFRTGPTQTNLYSHKRWLEAGKVHYPCCEHKGADQLRSYCEADKLICAFVFAYADCWFSHEAAHRRLQRCMFLSS